MGMRHKWTRSIRFKGCALAAPMLACAACGLFAATARGQSTEEALKARLVGQPLYLRGDWDSDKLKFNATGQLVGSSGKRPATLCGVDVSRIQIKGNDLTLEGHRAGLLLDPAPSRKLLNETIRIEVAAQAGGDFGPALDAIFTDTPADPPAPATAPAAEDSAQTTASAATVTQPVLVKSVNPQFTPAANQLKYSGTVTVHALIGKDGAVSHIQVAKPLGLGLDEQAVAAVSQYVFKPGTIDGKPAPMEMDINVNFVFRELPPASEIMIQ